MLTTSNRNMTEMEEMYLAEIKALRQSLGERTFENSQMEERIDRLNIANGELRVIIARQESTIDDLRSDVAFAERMLTKEAV